MKYSHAIPVLYTIKKGSLWPYKYPIPVLEELKRIDEFNFYAQYQQNPHERSGTLFETGWWRTYNIVPDFLYKTLFADTALKDGENNDYTVFQAWVKFEGKIYLVDQFREKVKAVDLEQCLIDFWNKHKGSGKQPTRAFYIEDKASGTQLIQAIQRRGGIPVLGIARHKSKVERAQLFASWIKAGLVWLPENTGWVYDYKTEFTRFTLTDQHEHDDQIDCTLDAIEKMLIEDIALYNENKQKGNQQSKKPVAFSKHDKNKRW